MMAWLGDEKSAWNRFNAFWTNAGEIYYLLAKRRSKAAAEHWWEETLPSLPVRLELPNLDEIREASRLKGSYAISYADAFAASLAFKYATRLTTGDPEFRAVERLRLNWVSAD